MKKQKYCSKAELYVIIKNVIIYVILGWTNNEANSNGKAIGS